MKEKDAIEAQEEDGMDLGNAKYVHGVRGDRVCVCVCVCVTHTLSLSLSLSLCLSLSLSLSLSPAAVAAAAASGGCRHGISYARSLQHSLSQEGRHPQTRQGAAR